MSPELLNRAPSRKADVAPGSFSVLLLGCAVYALLLLSDALRVFPTQPQAAPAGWHIWFPFSFSVLVGVLYLLVGSLVWLYARRRAVALVLFCFCTAIACSFAVQTGGVLNDRLLSAVGDAASAISIALLAVLLLLFPSNALAALPSSLSWRVRLARLWVVVLVVLCLAAACVGVLAYVPALTLPGWTRLLYYGYYAVALGSIIASIILGYRRLERPRERQQLRLFMLGVLLALAPLFLLTVLPDVLNHLLGLPPQFVADGRFSTLSFVFLPLALGYSILRYQVLIYDRYIRRVVKGITAGVGITILCYVVVVSANLALGSDLPGMLLILVIGMAALGSGVLWLAGSVTNRLFRRDPLWAQTLVASRRLPLEPMDLQKASRLLTQAVKDACEARDIALFVRSEQGQYYRMTSLLSGSGPENALESSGEDSTLLQRIGAFFPVEGDWLVLDPRSIDALLWTTYPLVPSEVLRSRGSRPKGGRMRYLGYTSLKGVEEPLLFPLAAQGQLAGVLVLGARFDRAPYAGPDFEVISDIVVQCLPALETARLYAEVNKRLRSLLTFYTNIMQDQAEHSCEEVAAAYAEMAAATFGDTARAVAQVWLYEEQDRHLACCYTSGTELQLPGSEILNPTSAQDWAPWFYQGSVPDGEASPIQTEVPPPCLPGPLPYPVAWLPLQGRMRRLGALVILYPQPHTFSTEEKCALLMFANQCADVLEVIRDRNALQHVLEVQRTKERLTDLFLQNTARELWTPLSIVQGYIELLRTYQRAFPDELRAEVLKNVSGVSAGVTQLIDQILAVSHLLLSTEQITLGAVSLLECVSQSVALLEGLSGQRRLPLLVDISPDLQVMGEPDRMRQVLVHLLALAFKYARAGRGLVLCCELSASEVTVRIRDGEAGASLKPPAHAFERSRGVEPPLDSQPNRADLSLFLSKQFVEDMGGRVWVEYADSLKGSVAVACVLRRASDLETSLSYR